MTDLTKGFAKMGARIRISESPRAMLTVDIRRDRQGEFFLLTKPAEADPHVLDVRPKERHLLLMAEGSKFLCGHDERHWFVAAVPGGGVTNVKAAMDALKPPQVWQAIRASGLRLGKRNRRKTEAFIRQGEWFFLPRPRMVVDQLWVMLDEPIRRGSGKPHLCQYLYRTGGETVFVHRRHPNGLSAPEFARLSEDERSLRGWRRMQRDAAVYVRGAVRHPDHKTIHLPHWHQVVMNTESQAPSMRHVAFLD
jgi:hypothetical protein